MKQARSYDSPGIWLALCLLLAVSCAGGPVTNTESVETMNEDSMAYRLKCLEDREAIRQLLIDYGKFLDQRDFASFSRLFSEQDGAWIGGMGEARGRRAIQDLMEEKIGGIATGSNSPNYHLFQNEQIHLNGDRAEAETKWVFVVQNENGRPEPLYLGHYEDQLIRNEEGWKFLKRTVYSDIPKDNPGS